MRCFRLTFFLQQSRMLAQDGPALLCRRCVCGFRWLTEIFLGRTIIAVGLIVLTHLGVEHGPVPVGYAPFRRAWLHRLGHYQNLLVELLQRLLLVVEGGEGDPA